MKTIAALLCTPLLALGIAAQAQTAAPAPAAVPASAACPKLLQFSFPRLQDEKPQALCQYAGKVLLVVNTASYCGFTPQYEGLEAMYAKYGPQGLVVLGFPTNDFGQQEPKDGKEIADFCFNTYGVKFPMFGKTVVKGPQANNPFIAELSKATGKAPAWNFNKYFVKPNGTVTQYFGSRVAPDSPQFGEAVEKLLK